MKPERSRQTQREMLCETLKAKWKSVLPAACFICSSISVFLQGTDASLYVRLLVIVCILLVATSLILSLFLSNKRGANNIFDFVIKLAQGALVAVIFLSQANEVSFIQQIVFLYLLIVADTITLSGHIVRVLVAIAALCCGFKAVFPYISIVLSNLDSLANVVTALIHCWLKDSENNSAKKPEAAKFPEGQTAVQGNPNMITFPTHQNKLDNVHSQFNPESFQTAARNISKFPKGGMHRPDFETLGISKSNKFISIQKASQQKSNNFNNLGIQFNFENDFEQKNKLLKAQFSLNIGNPEAHPAIKPAEIRRNSINSFDFFNETDMPGSTSHIIKEIETEYMSMLDHLILVADSNLSIIYNNYHERFYNRIIRKIQKRVNIDSLRIKNGVSLYKCFIPLFKNFGPQQEKSNIPQTLKNLPVDGEIKGTLDTEENTMLMLLKMKRVFERDMPHSKSGSISSFKSVQNSGLENLFKEMKIATTLDVLKDIEDAKRRREMMKSKKQIQIEKKLNNTMPVELADSNLTIAQILGFLQAFFQFAIMDTSFQYPIVLKFYIEEKILMKFIVKRNVQTFYFYVVFENIDEKIALGQLNSKLNYSYMLFLTLSHELYTPISQALASSEKMIKSSGNYLRNQVQDEALLCHSVCTGLKFFVQNILAFGKYIIKTLDLNLSEVYLGEILKQVSSIFQVKIQKLGIKFNISMEKDVLMFTDIEKLSGLLFNFLENAVKYTRKGGVNVIIKEGQTAEFVKIDIVDTGIGINEDDLQKIILILENPFLDTRTEYAAGIGIGFRIAKILLMYLTGGDIYLDIASKKGEGTTISFEILKKARLIDSNHIYHERMKSPKTINSSVDFEFQRKLLHVAKGIKEMVSPPFRHEALKESDETISYDSNGGLAAQIHHQGSSFGSPSPINGPVGVRPEKKSPFSLDLIPKLKRVAEGRHFSDKEKEENSQENLRHFKMDRTFKKLITASICMKALEGEDLAQNLEAEEPQFISPRRSALKFDDRQKLSMSRNEVEPINNSDSIPEKLALVVDDEILNADLLQDIIESFGVKAVAAYDGEMALEICMKYLILNQKVDIIFMDYSMPGMSGDECTRKLKDLQFKQILKDTPIIGLTAHRDQEIASKCLAAGMKRVDYKPFTREKIGQILEEERIILSQASSVSEQYHRKATLQSKES